MRRSGYGFAKRGTELGGPVGQQCKRTCRERREKQRYEEQEGKQHQCQANKGEVHGGDGVRQSQSSYHLWCGQGQVRHRRRHQVGQSSVSEEKIQVIIGSYSSIDT